MWNGTIDGRFSQVRIRATLPVGAPFYLLRDPTRSVHHAPAGIRAQLRSAARAAGLATAAPRTSEPAALTMPPGVWRSAEQRMRPVREQLVDVA
jgi:hypothetical protein